MQGNYAMDHKSVQLKQEPNKQELNWENIIITINKYLIHFESLPACHLNKKFILNPVESSRSAPARNLNSQQLVMD